MDMLQRLKDLREDHDLTQQKLSNLLGMKQQQYARYETGETKIPVEVIVKLAEIYNVSTDYLLGLTNTPNHFRKPDNGECGILKIQ